MVIIGDKKVQLKKLLWNVENINSSFIRYLLMNQILTVNNLLEVSDMLLNKPKWT